MSPSLRRTLLLATLLAPVTLPALSQTLAQPHWAGSGLTAEPWWRSAVLYQLDPHTFAPGSGEGPGDLAGVARHLDYLQNLNVDAILLAPLKTTAASGDPLQNPLYGAAAPTELDDLIQQASARRIRLLVDIPLAASTSPDALTGLARLWLSRGVAGLRLTRDPAAPPTPEQFNQALHTLRPLLNTFGGQRVLLADPGPDATASPDAQLTLVSPLPALRAVLTRTLTDTRPPAPVYAAIPANDAQSRLTATVLLTHHAAALLQAGQELGAPLDAPIPWPDATRQDADPKSLLAFYRTLSSLHHGHAAFTTGSDALLETGNPDVVAWIRRPTAGNPVILVVNLSQSQAHASLNPALRGFLRSILPSIAGFIPPMRVEDITLPPYGTYLGELRK